MEQARSDDRFHSSEGIDRRLDGVPRRTSQPSRSTRRRMARPLKTASAQTSVRLALWMKTTSFSSERAPSAS